MGWFLVKPGAGHPGSQCLGGYFQMGGGWNEVFWLSAWPNQVLPPEMNSLSSLMVEAAPQKILMLPGVCGGFTHWVIGWCESKCGFGSE